MSQFKKQRKNLNNLKVKNNKKYKRHLFQLIKIYKKDKTEKMIKKQLLKNWEFAQKSVMQLLKWVINIPLKFNPSLCHIHFKEKI